MDDLYKHIEALGKRAGYKNMTKLCEAAGVPRSTMSEINNGRSKDISKPNAQKFAELLGVSLDEVYGKEKAPALIEKDERDIAKDLEQIMDQLDNSGDLMFDGYPMSGEARERIKAAIRLGLESAKVQNKKRFTPKKYRKE